MRRSTHALAITLLVAIKVHAQSFPESTRLTVAGAPILSHPEQEFRQNVGNGFGAEGALLYHLDRPGILSLRFDVSGFEYGRESRRVPLSGTIGRIIVKETTTNSIVALSFGPEVALPHGPVRP